MNLRMLIVVGVALCLSSVVASECGAHCQIPCGIYGDQMRFEMMEEHLQTIEKSMTMIEELSAAENKNMNQIVRWVNNKEEHASEFTEIVTFYFMAQRIKPVQDEKSPEYQDYIRKVTLLHQMVVYAMKAKQTTDLENVTKLRELVGEFRIAYLGPQEDKAEEHQH